MLRVGGAPDGDVCGAVDPTFRLVPAVLKPYLCAVRAGDGAPATRLDAWAPDFVSAPHGPGWVWKRLDEKRPLGWVGGNGTTGGTLELNATTSASPRLEVTFLRSGTTPLGSAELILSGPGCPGGARVRLDGVGGAKSTVPVMLSLDAAQTSAAADGSLYHPWPCTGEGGAVTLQFTVSSHKPWVLFQVAAC